MEGIEMTDRGLSEVLGFVFTFSMIILSVGVLYISGFSAVQEVQQFEQGNNAERAMETLSRNFGAHEQGVPARSSEIRLLGGTFTVTNSSTIDITVSGSGISDTTRTIHPRSVVFNVEQRSYHYEAGGLFLEQNNNSHMIRSPSFACDTDFGVISITSIQPRNDISISTTESITVNARLKQSELVFPPTFSTNATDGENVNVTISKSKNSDGWHNYFTDQSSWSQDGSIYTCSADRIYVRVTNVEFWVLS